MTLHDHLMSTTSATAIERLMPGVYFGLDETTYHADPALGSGDLRDIARCPMYYWQKSNMNPMRAQDVDTPALLYGRALHKLVLEGRQAFVGAYTAAPEASDHPGCLETATQITAALKELGVKGYSGKAKAEVAAMLKAANPGAVILDDIVAAHAAEAQRTGKTILKRDVFNDVVIAAGSISQNPAIARAFQGGRPEVTVVWEDDGVMRKARIDYIRLGRHDGRLVAAATDLKSFVNQRSIAPERAVAFAVTEYRLDMQAAHNIDGARMIPSLIAAGRVFGASDVSADWLKALSSIAPDAWLWYWAFFQKDAPVSMLRHAKPGLITSGKRSVDAALQSYREHMAAFGAEWRYADPMPDQCLDVGDMPAWYANAA